MKLDKYPIIKIRQSIYPSDYPIFTCFYTSNNGYTKYANNLITSLEYFKIPYYIYDIHNENDSWEMLCQLKPKLLRIVLDKFPNKNIVWIDADAKIERTPILFENIDKSFAAHYCDKRLISSTLFFKNNDISRHIINDWILENNKNHQEWDQVTLQRVIRNKYKNHEYVLPKEYCSIFDRPGYQNIDRVISQWQASRELKPKSNNNILLIIVIILLLYILT